MSLNIIVRDKRPERVRQDAELRREHFKGRYWQECRGTRYSSRFTARQIKRIWERETPVTTGAR